MNRAAEGVGEVEWRRVTRRAAAMFPYFALALAFAWGLFQADEGRDLLFRARRGEVLARECDRLRGAVVVQETRAGRERLLRLRAEVEEGVARARGLPFLEDVAYGELAPGELRGVIGKMLSEQFSDRELGDFGEALACLGFTRRRIDLKRELLDLLGEQVAAFYDQHASKLYALRGDSLDAVGDRVILAHELVHALQDQHFELRHFPLEIKDNDDRVAATQALIEGDATLVMTQYLAENLSLNAVGEALASVFEQRMDAYLKAPRYLRETLMFPYMRGQEFCTQLNARGGQEAINEAFLDPPVSTAQILHPEKYLQTPREDPIPVGWVRLQVLGRAPIVENVAGELGVRLLLGEWLEERVAERAAAGWRGDRYVVYRSSPGEPVHCVWKTIWDSPGNAREFLDALERTLRIRHGPAGWRKAGDEVRLSGKRRVTLEILPANRVLLVDAADAAWHDALRAHYGGDAPPAERGGLSEE